MDIVKQEDVSDIYLQHLKEYPGKIAIVKNVFEHPNFIISSDPSCKPEIVDRRGTFSLGLEEVYRCTEQITTMLHNRNETITFEKLKVAVQQMLRKNFNVSYLKQIKTVFPEAYRFVNIFTERG